MENINCKYRQAQQEYKDYKFRTHLIEDEYGPKRYNTM